MDIKYDIVFVVLVYRNIDDLKNFFISNNLPRTKTIVVNSYYDDVSEESFKKIARDNDAVFLSVPNKGYGAGNNRGIDYALSTFDFKYLVVSNADILIERIDLDVLKKLGDVIIAPRIINMRNKNQNPSTPFNPSKIIWKLWMYIYTNDLRSLSWGMFALSRIKRNIYYLIAPIRKRIFAAHGSFVIFPEHVLKQLVPIYNEKMFLFAEEEHLGMLAQKKGIKTYYAPEIEIKHKENGSMSMASVNEFERMKQSYLEFYHYWFKK